MSTVITTAGEQLIAQKIGAGAVLSIDTIILAHIPDLDLDSPVDREQGKPQPENVVQEYAIPEDFKGYVNPNQVVYSMLLGSEIGNFQFNWLGLYSSADDVLIAVTHLPVTQKWQTDKGSNTLGNNLTRNFMLEFSGAKAVTNITVEAKTWQVDFTARLRSIDERERRSSRDIYGRSCFFNDGFSVVKDGSSYVLKAGAGYVEGIRCVLNSDLVLAVSGLPKNVFIDVSLQQQGSDVVPVVEPALVQDKADFEDVNLVQHYLVKVAEISSVGFVTDVRRTEAVTSDLVEYLKQQTGDVLFEVEAHAKDKNDPHKTMARVSALKSSSIISESVTHIATSFAVNEVRKLIQNHVEDLDKHGSIDFIDLGSRSTSGYWTLVNLQLMMPVFIMAGTNFKVGIPWNVVSGSMTHIPTSDGFWSLDATVSGKVDGNGGGSAVLVPNQATLIINIKSIESGANVRAFQLVGA